MKATTLATLLLVATAARAAPQSVPEPEDNPKGTPGSHNAVTKSLRDFNSEVFIQLSKKEKGNFVYSPFSLHLALTVLAQGAPVGSETHAELVKFLELQNVDLSEDFVSSYRQIIANQLALKEDDGTQLKLANRLFTAKDVSLKQDFLQTTGKNYKTEVENLDFASPSQATRTINSFVNNQTNGLIPRLFEDDALDAASKLALVNVIYFKGFWRFPFDANDTRPMNFSINPSHTINYSYGMNLVKEVGVATIADIDSDVLELPYADGDLSMLVVLPQHDVENVETFFRRFDPVKIVGVLATQTAETEIQLPRFEASYDWSDLSESLKASGVRTLFEEDRANLTNISDEPLYVTKAVHKTVIKVNEEGSEAAAASGVAINVRVSVTPEKKSFIVNRPFIFCIYDKKNNLPLFMGRIVDPTGRNTIDSAAELRSVSSARTAGDDDHVDLPARGEDLMRIKQNQEHNEKTENERFTTFKDNKSIRSAFK